MVSNYQHHLYPKQSEYVKYRGKTGQIDIKDSIISVLAAKPGLNAEDIAGHIFHHNLKKSWYMSVPRALDALEADTAIIKEEASGQYYLMNDAMSHDIGKTQQYMDRLLAKGLKPEQVTFLSSAIIMAGEQARAEHEGRNYHPNETVASSPAIVPPAPEKQEVVEFDEAPTLSHVIGELNDTPSFIELHAIEPDDAEFQKWLNENGIILEIVQPEIMGFHIKLYGKYQDLVKAIEMYWDDMELVDEIKPLPVQEPEQEIAISNPFENLSEAEQAQLKDDVIRDIRLAAEAEENERLRLIAEKEEADRLAAAAAAEAAEKAKEEAKQQAYKNKLSSIRSATDLLGLDVEVNLPDLSGQVVGTILEIKPDGVLFLIVFSQDSKYPEGSIQNIFYRDNLSYKIMA